MTMADLSGNGRTMEQDTGASQPTQTANRGPKNLTMLSCDGTNDHLFLLTGVTYSGADGMSFMCVSQLTSGTTILSVCGGNNAGNPQLRYNDGGGTNLSAQLLRSGQASLIQTAANVFVADSFNVVGFTASTNVSEIHHNGGNTANSSDPAFTETFSRLMQSRGGEFFSGLYGEALLFVPKLTLRNKRLVEGYLSWRWGVPLAASHPFVNRPPLIGD